MHRRAFSRYNSSKLDYYCFMVIARDKSNGRYTDSKFDKPCTCGHTLGQHTADKLAGCQPLPRGLQLRMLQEGEGGQVKTIIETRRIRVGDTLKAGTTLTRRLEMLDGGEQVSVYNTVTIDKANQRVTVWAHGKLAHLPVCNFEVRNDSL